MLGECPDLKNLFVCTGFNSHGITVGPSAGDFIADWIEDGGTGLRKDWFGMVRILICYINLIYV